MRYRPATAARLSIVLAAATAVLGLALPAASAASPPSSDAVYSRAAMTARERAIVNQALGKVTKAGKVAGIDAQVGDYVLGCSVPDNFSGQDPCPAADPGGSGPVQANTTLTDAHASLVRTMAPPTAATLAATAAATTVLHASSLGTRDASPGPNNTLAEARTQLAIEENTSGGVRLYHRQSLAYGPAGDISTYWSTYHDATTVNVYKGDEDNNEADNCLGFYADHCSATADAGDSCRGGTGGPCTVWLRVGTYRAKGNGPNLWLTQTERPDFWHPILNNWYAAGRSCNSSYRVGYMWAVDGSPGPFPPAVCPVPNGRTFA